MNDKRFVGVYHNETDLMNKMDELKSNGYVSDNMYVIAKDESNLSMLRSRTSADIQTTHEESWLDRFMDFLSGEDRVYGMFDRLGIDRTEAEQYTSNLNNGDLLLYVDEGEAFNLNESSVHTDTGYKNDHVDSFGQVGGEALLDRTRYEAPPTYVSPDEERMQLREERLEVDKREVESGHVHLEKNIVEDQQSIDVPITREEVYIERRAVTDGETINSGAMMNENEETIHIPVTEERLEVTKKPIVTEEIIVGKRQVQDIETVSDTVRREEVNLEQDGNIDIEGDDLVNRQQTANDVDTRFKY